MVVVSRLDLKGTSGVYKILVPAVGNPNYIRQLLVTERGLNPISVQAAVGGINRQVLFTRPELIEDAEDPKDNGTRQTAALERTMQFLEEDPNRHFLIGNALLAPWANRAWSKEKDGDGMVINWQGKKITVPINFAGENTQDVMTGIHGTLFNFQYNKVTPVEYNDPRQTFGVLGEGLVENWLGQKLSISHFVGIKWSAFYRRVSLTNQGSEPVIAGVGEHPYFLFPNGVKRLAASVNIPAEFWVANGKTPPKMFPQGLTAVGKSPLGALFIGEGNKGLLGNYPDTIDDCFTGLIPVKKELLDNVTKEIQASLKFPGQNGGYRIEVSAPYLANSNNAVKAIVVYSQKNPLDHPAGIDRDFLCFEFQTNLLGAFEMDTWGKIIPDFQGRGWQTPSGMMIIGPHSSMTWEVEHRIYKE